MLRLIILILIFIYHREIFNYLKKFNISSFENFKKNISDKNKKFENFIKKGPLNNTLITLKKTDKKTYKECKIILHNILILKDRVLERKKNYRYDYENIFYEKKKLMNILSSLIVKKGFLKNHKLLIDDFDFYITKIIDELKISLRNSKYNSDWVDVNHYSVEPIDENINYNYDIY